MVEASGRFSNFPWFGKPLRFIFGALLSLSAAIVSANPVLREIPGHLRLLDASHWGGRPRTV